MKRILLLSKYGSRAASTRYRYTQFFENQSDWSLVVSPLLDDNYLLAQYQGKRAYFSIFKGFIKRWAILFTVFRYDLVLINYEAFPYLPAFYEKILSLFKPYVLDLDDAIYHQYDQHKNLLVRFFLKKKIARVLGYASGVVVGNDYLYQYAIRYQKNIIIVPTVVSAEKYKKINSLNSNSAVVGWIGSPSTAKYLTILSNVLQKISEHTLIRVIGSGKYPLDFPCEKKQWFEHKEISDIQSFSIGIMPLTDDLWSRGKCGFKLIQYMACGIPVIASPVGVNNKIVIHGENGFLATSNEEWEKYFSLLLSDPLLREKMGECGRVHFEKNYSMEKWREFYLGFLRQQG